MKLLLLWGGGSERGAALADLHLMITFCLDINNKKLFFFQRQKPHNNPL